MVTAVFAERLKLRKNQLIELLASQGIDCRPFFHPLSSLPAYASTPEAEAARIRNKVSYALSPYGINLPSALSLTRTQVRQVAAAVREVVVAADNS